MFLAHLVLSGMKVAREESSAVRHMFMYALKIRSKIYMQETSSRVLYNLPSSVNAYFAKHDTTIANCSAELHESFLCATLTTSNRCLVVSYADGASHKMVSLETESIQQNGHHIGRTFTFLLRGARDLEIYQDLPANVIIVTESGMFSLFSGIAEEFRRSPDDLCTLRPKLVEGFVMLPDEIVTAASVISIVPLSGTSLPSKDMLVHSCSLAATMLVGTSYGRALCLTVEFAEFSASQQSIEKNLLPMVISTIKSVILHKFKKAQPPRVTVMERRIARMRYAMRHNPYSGGQPANNSAPFNNANYDCSILDVQDLAGVSRNTSSPGFLTKLITGLRGDISSSLLGNSAIGPNDTFLLNALDKNQQHASNALSPALAGFLAPTIMKPIIRLEKSQIDSLDEDIRYAVSSTLDPVDSETNQTTTSVGLSQPMQDAFFSVQDIEPSGSSARTTKKLLLAPIGVGLSDDHKKIIKPQKDIVRGIRAYDSLVSFIFDERVVVLTDVNKHTAPKNREAPFYEGSLNYPSDCDVNLLSGSPRSAVPSYSITAIVDAGHITKAIPEASFVSAERLFHDNMSILRTFGDEKITHIHSLVDCAIYDSNRLVLLFIGINAHSDVIFYMYDYFLHSRMLVVRALDVRSQSSLAAWYNHEKSHNGLGTSTGTLSHHLATLFSLSSDEKCPVDKVLLSMKDSLCAHTALPRLHISHSANNSAYIVLPQSVIRTDLCSHKDIEKLANMPLPSTVESTYLEGGDQSLQLPKIGSICGRPLSDYHQYSSGIIRPFFEPISAVGGILSNIAKKFATTPALQQPIYHYCTVHYDIVRGTISNIAQNVPKNFGLTSKRDMIQSIREYMYPREYSRPTRPDSTIARSGVPQSDGDPVQTNGLYESTGVFKTQINDISGLAYYESADSPAHQAVKRSTAPPINRILPNNLIVSFCSLEAEPIRSSANLLRFVYQSSLVYMTLSGGILSVSGPSIGKSLRNVGFSDANPHIQEIEKALFSEMRELRLHRDSKEYKYVAFMASFDAYCAGEAVFLVTDLFSSREDLRAVTDEVLAVLVNRAVIDPAVDLTWCSNSVLGAIDIEHVAESEKSLLTTLHNHKLVLEHYLLAIESKCTRVLQLVSFLKDVGFWKSLSKSSFRTELLKYSDALSGICHLTKYLCDACTTHTDRASHNKGPGVHGADMNMHDLEDEAKYFPRWSTLEEQCRCVLNLERLLLRSIFELDSRSESIRQKQYTDSNTNRIIKGEVSKYRALKLKPLEMVLSSAGIAVCPGLPVLSALLSVLGNAAESSSDVPLFSTNAQHMLQSYIEIINYVCAYLFGILVSREENRLFFEIQDPEMTYKWLTHETFVRLQQLITVIMSSLRSAEPVLGNKSVLHSSIAAEGRQQRADFLSALCCLCDCYLRLQYYSCRASEDSSQLESFQKELDFVFANLYEITSLNIMCESRVEEVADLFAKYHDWERFIMYSIDLYVIRDFTRAEQSRVTLFSTALIKQLTAQSLANYLDAFHDSTCHLEIAGKSLALPILPLQLLFFIKKALEDVQLNVGLRPFSELFVTICNVFATRGFLRRLSVLEAAPTRHTSHNSLLRFLREGDFVSVATCPVSADDPLAIDISCMFTMLRAE